jgi:hypothetical protein
MLKQRDFANAAAAKYYKQSQLKGPEFVLLLCCFRSVLKLVYGLLLVLLSVLMGRKKGQAIALFSLLN